jgi:hypothetical protein
LKAGSRPLTPFWILGLVKNSAQNHLLPDKSKYQPEFTEERIQSGKRIFEDKWARQGG